MSIISVTDKQHTNLSSTGAAAMLLGFTHDMFSTQQAENEVLGLCSGSFTDSQQIRTSQQHSQERNQESSQEG
mgnify:CR=1 FL=1